MIGRIHERRTFERLRRQGRRVGTEHLWCRFLPDPSIVPPRVGFAIGRAVGRATTRNRLRRRLRTLVGAQASAGTVPGGWWMIGAQPTAPELTYGALEREVSRLIARSTAEAAR